MKIQLVHICKNFGEIKANQDITIDFLPGTIHGILGENGAGKSTLMKILAGFLKKTTGEILIDGRPCNLKSPETALRHGIGMLYQDPMDFPQLTVLENFMAGAPTGFFTSDLEYRQKLENIISHLGFALNPVDQVRNLTVGERQQLELVRLLHLGADALIMDEPTTGISDLQKDSLFKALGKLVSEGKTIIIVSHKLKDIQTLCHKVSVLRQGRVAGEIKGPFDKKLLLKLMFGDLPSPRKTSDHIPGSAILKMQNVSAKGGRTGLSQCNTSIHQREIIGLAGLEGSGQEIFLRLAGGFSKANSGTIIFRGKKIDNSLDYNFLQPKGVSFLPAARLDDGLIPGLTIKEHFALKNAGKKMLISWKNAENESSMGIEEFQVKGSPESRVESLSGGNQQRLLLSLLPHDPRVLLLEQPTRGLDLASARWVWEQLQAYCSEQASIVFASSDLDEILSYSDRILVFFNGRIVKDLKKSETDIDEIGQAIAGLN